MLKYSMRYKHRHDILAPAGREIRGKEGFGQHPCSIGAICFEVVYTLPYFRLVYYFCFNLPKSVTITLQLHVVILTTVLYILTPCQGIPACFSV